MTLGGLNACEKNALVHTGKKAKNSNEKAADSYRNDPKYFYLSTDEQRVYFSAFRALTIF